MSELSIRVNIAGRIYPLTIKREEEFSVRQAAKSIEKSIKKMQDDYGVQDKQDLLAMTALQLSTELQALKDLESSAIKKDELQELDAYIDQII